MTTTTRLSVPRESKEYLTVEWDTDITLDEQTVHIAAIAMDARPASGDWQAATWIGDSGTTRQAQVLQGISPLDLAPGTYRVWSKLIDQSEEIVRSAGVLSVT